MKKTNKEITDYDYFETTEFIEKRKRLTLADLGFKLPKESPTKVISIRLPTELYNRIRAYSTNLDVPYHAYIKFLLRACCINPFLRDLTLVFRIKSRFFSRKTGLCNRLLNDGIQKNIGYRKKAG